jgi:CO/xanthine dehydrogenase Mo-binding subunit
VGGARITRIEGIVVGRLVERVRARLAGLLAAEIGCEAGAIQAVAGGFRGPDGRMHNLAATAALAAEDVVEYVLHESTESEIGRVFQAQAVEVRVDPETGQVTPLRVVSVHEVGRVVLATQHQGQIEGGVLQGLGYALMEELRVEDGRVATANLHEYKVPTAADVPDLETILLPPDQGLGITPIGEGPMVGVAPAVANAVVDRVGPRAFDLPVSPEAVAGVRPAAS